MSHIHELYDFTVSFYIIHPTQKKLCLHYHLKLECWNQLGGHIELDEHPIESLKRELSEEVGFSESDYSIIETHTDSPQARGVSTLPAPFSVVIYNYGDTPHKHIDLPYIIQSKTEELKPAEGESKEIGWFSIEEIREMHKNGKVHDSTLDIYEWVVKIYM